MKRLSILMAMAMGLTSLPALAAETSPATPSETAATAVAGDSERRHPHKKVIVKKRKKGRKKVVVHRRRRGKTVVVRPVVKRHRHVVVHSGPPVVETVHVVPKRRRAVTTQQYHRRPVEDSMLGIGLRVSGVTVNGEKLNLATLENPTMGGLGLQIRGKVSRNVGLELAADWLYGKTDDVAQTTVPVTLSALYYFIPRGTFKLYGLLGGGVHLTKLEYDLGFRHDLVELAGQAGGGIELRLSRDFSLNADLRFIGLYKNISDSDSIQTRCVGYTGMNHCSGVQSTDKFNVGAQFMAGANFYF